MPRIPDVCAIMAVDPGGTTGVAQALLRPADAGNMTLLMKRCVKKDALRVAEIRPEPAEPGSLVARASSAEQAAKLYNTWLSFIYMANTERSIPIPDIHLVIEDFQLRQRSADLAPVEVTYALLAYLRGSGGTWAGMSLAPDDRLRFQPAAEAKTFATSDRMRMWGVWAVGKEHGRDALRHLCLRASKILDGE